jgi:D-amino peptidase
MRVLLWTDMEGMSRVVDHRECWPVFTEYWERGRQKFTDEVKAAARGLLEGGAEKVFVVNAHGLGWPNLLWAELPDGAVAPDDGEWGKGFDAAFFVGFHARAGTRDGFISHTMVPGLTVTADSAPLTEVHIWALLEEVPVLGVAGDAALGDQLDGIVADVPFLAVKRSSSRHETRPADQTDRESYRAITDFAAGCVAMPLHPLETSDFRLEMTIEPGQVMTTQVKNFKRDGYPLLLEAMNAALRPMLEVQGELDLSSRDALDRQDPDAVTRFRAFFEDWVLSPIDLS